MTLAFVLTTFNLLASLTDEVYAAEGYPDIEGVTIDEDGILRWDRDPEVEKYYCELGGGKEIALIEDEGEYIDLKWRVDFDVARDAFDQQAIHPIRLLALNGDNNIVASWVGSYFYKSPYSVAGELQNVNISQDGIITWDAAWDIPYNKEAKYYYVEVQCKGLGTAVEFPYTNSYDLLSRLKKWMELGYIESSGTCELIIEACSDRDITLAKWEGDYSYNIDSAIEVVAPTGKTLTYNGKAQTGVDSGVGYTLSETTTATNAGTYTATATLKEGYVWLDGKTEPKTITWKINKAGNPLTIKAKTATVKYSKVKKKAQTLTVGKVIAFTKKGQGKTTYTKASGNKKIVINKTTGKVTVKKGLKKGTYKVKVKVKAAGNANYNASGWKTVTFKVKVK